MTTLRALLERRAAVKTELQGIIAQHPETLPAEVQTRWEELTGEADGLEQRITRQATVDDLERRIQGTPITGPGTPRREVRAFAGTASEVPEGFDGLVLRGQHGEAVPILEQRHRLADFLPRSESRASELGFGGYLRALYHGASNDLERRVLAEGSQGAGGALVPAPLAAEIIDLLRARSVAFAAGVRTIPMASQTLKFAKVLTDPVGGWRAENAPIVEGEPTFGSTTLTAKSWALLTRVSRELIEDGQNTDAVLRAAFANAAALALDTAILYGTGSANQPLGVANQPGIQTIAAGGANGAALAGWAKIIDAVAALEAANAGTVSAVIWPPRSARVVYGLADSTGQPLEVPPRLRNIPLLSTTSMPITETQGTSNNSSSILLGDFSEVFCGIRTSLTISVLNERYADNGQIGFVTWLRADCGVARPAALARIAGVIA